MRCSGWPRQPANTILRDDPRLRRDVAPGMNIAYLAFSTDKPPLNIPPSAPCAGLAYRWQTASDAVDLYGTAETAASILPSLSRR